MHGIPDTIIPRHRPRPAAQAHRHILIPDRLAIALIKTTDHKQLFFRMCTRSLELRRRSQLWRWWVGIVGRSCWRCWIERDAGVLCDGVQRCGAADAPLRMHAQDARGWIRVCL